MQISISTANRPKPGFTAAACEDAWAPETGPQDSAANFRCAVADGASTSAYSRPWAQILVRDFLAENPLSESQAAWREIVAVGDSDVPWWLTHKVAEGAHSAFIGLEINETGWQAIAWGDACLFHVRSSHILSSFPLQSAADFPDQPTLLSSIGDNPVALEASGEWSPGDHFLLATDAVARQLFELPITDTVWSELAPANDDMTLMRVQLS